MWDGVHHKTLRAVRFLGETPRWGFPSLIAPQSNSPFPALGKEKGVSLSADSDGGLCPLNPCKLLKKLDQNFRFASRVRMQKRAENRISALFRCHQNGIPKGEYPFGRGRGGRRPPQSSLPQQPQPPLLPPQPQPQPPSLLPQPQPQPQPLVNSRIRMMIHQMLLQLFPHIVILLYHVTQACACGHTAESSASVWRF